MMRKMYKMYSVTLLLVLVGTGLASSCSNIDCPLNNTVFATYKFYQMAGGGSYTLGDTLTVTTAGSDSVLYNRGYRVQSVNLPMSYLQTEDTLLFHLATPRGQWVDTLFVRHTNEPHFESLDCGTAMFHTVQHVRWARSVSGGVPYIDSVAVVVPKINYDEKENFKIYYRTR